MIERGGFAQDLGGEVARAEVALASAWSGAQDTLFAWSGVAQAFGGVEEAWAEIALVKCLLEHKCVCLQDIELR